MGSCQRRNGKNNTANNNTLQKQKEEKNSKHQRSLCFSRHLRKAASYSVDVYRYHMIDFFNSNFLFPFFLRHKLYYLYRFPSFNIRLNLSPVIKYQN